MQRKNRFNRGVSRREKCDGLFLFRVKYSLCPAQKNPLAEYASCQNATAVTTLRNPATRSAGNRPQRLHKWHTGLPVLGRGDAHPSLQRHLSASADTSMAALVPERVMVRAAGHWSNTTSLWTHQCSNWRNCSFRAAYQTENFVMDCKTEK
jgi:hypothetical protein